LGASQTTATPTFVFRCDFIIGFGKHKLCTRFEVARLNHFSNIIKRRSNFGKRSRSQGLSPLFSERGFMIDLGKSQQFAKFEIDNFSRWRNIKEKLPNMGELPYHITTATLVC